MDSITHLGFFVLDNGVLLTNELDIYNICHSMLEDVNGEFLRVKNIPPIYKSVGDGMDTLVLLTEEGKVILFTELRDTGVFVDVEDVYHIFSAGSAHFAIDGNHVLRLIHFEEEGIRAVEQKEILNNIMLEPLLEGVQYAAAFYLDHRSYNVVTIDMNGNPTIHDGHNLLYSNDDESRSIDLGDRIIGISEPYIFSSHVIYEVKWVDYELEFERVLTLEDPIADVIESKGDLYIINTYGGLKVVNAAGGTTLIGSGYEEFYYNDGVVKAVSLDGKRHNLGRLRRPDLSH